MQQRKKSSIRIVATELIMHMVVPRLIYLLK